MTKKDSRLFILKDNTLNDEAYYHRQHMMSSFSSFAALVFIFLSSIVWVHSSDKFSRYDFPSGFVFGAGSSAYQVEGAAKEDGRTASIWDKYAEAGHEVGTSDQYHKYKEDVKLMVEAGLDAYRLSISWSRLIPNGRGPINPRGLEYYNNLLNELTANGIEPHVTLHHSDHPQSLEDEYGGWVDRKIVEDFTAYADVCFHHFGDRVKYWTTLNEANVFIIMGFNFGATPPQRCTANFFINCTRGNSSTEPYLAGHNMLLAHALAVKLYKEKYQGKQNGLIGINLFGFNVYPKTDSIQDAVATQRAKDFLLGWFMNPLTSGDYPKAMKETVGSRLPNFMPEEAEMVKGSYNFIALNHYYSIPASHRSGASWSIDIKGFTSDMGVDINFVPPVNEDPFLSEFPVQPWGRMMITDKPKKIPKGMKHKTAAVSSAEPEFFISGHYSVAQNRQSAPSYFIVRYAIESSRVVSFIAQISMETSRIRIDQDIHLRFLESCGVIYTCPLFSPAGFGLYCIFEYITQRFALWNHGTRKLLEVVPPSPFCVRNHPEYEPAFFFGNVKYKDDEFSYKVGIFSAQRRNSVGVHRLHLYSSSSNSWKVILTPEESVVRCWMGDGVNLNGKFHILWMEKKRRRMIIS
uniref:Beta-glucosidase n=2 Tax=Kalanchoe fedtschenkoi TaxID=63787 RepID=A0A7N0SZP6_KALFE